MIRLSMTKQQTKESDAYAIQADEPVIVSTVRNGTHVVTQVSRPGGDDLVGAYDNGVFNVAWQHGEDAPLIRAARAAKNWIESVLVGMGVSPGSLEDRHPYVLLKDVLEDLPEDVT